MKSLSKNRKLLIFVILLIILSFFLLDLDKYLTLEYLKSSNTYIMEYYHANQIKTITLFFLTYVLMATLSLPGAAVMTIAAGFIFGLVGGTIIVSFASSIGATICMVLTRYLFRDYVELKYKDKLKTVNKGIKTHGAYYLFTLRLIPLFPFFVINLVMGLTKLKVKTFYFVSQIGMLLGTMVYVNAGNQLAMIDDMGRILTPGLIFSFVLIGVFPLLIKLLVGYFTKKKNGRK